VALVVIPTVSASDRMAAAGAMLTAIFSHAADRNGQAVGDRAAF